MSDTPSSTIIARKKTRKRKSIAAQLSKKDLVSVTEHAPDVICRFDKGFKLLYVNPAIEVATGIPQQAFINKTTRELGMPEEHSAHWEKHIAQVVQTGQQTTMEFPFMTPKAGLKFFQAVLVPEFTDDGIVETVLTISRDITEKKELERKKEEAVSFVSHELKTPVTSLKISAQMLQRKFIKEGDSNSAAQLERMNKQIDKLTNIIGDLMDTTRIEQGTMKLHKQSFDFNELLQETVVDVQQTDDGHNIVILGKASQLLHADKFRIGQVLINLLSNAIRYSPDEEKIVVNVSTDKNTLVCSVKDLGIGIPSEQQMKIFDRFYRVQDVEQGIYLGLGLGLFIAAEIVKLHDGKIWVESKIGKGSTFIFTLPLTQ